MENPGKYICIPSRMQKILQYVLLLGLVLTVSSERLNAQDAVADTARLGIEREAMHIKFRVAKANIEKGYMDNEPVLDQIVDWAKGIQRDTMRNIIGVEFTGAVSPEGGVKFNRWLSVARLNALEKFVRKDFEISDDLVSRSDHYIAWDHLKEMVMSSEFADKEAVLEIINSENTSTGYQLDSRITALKALDGGKTWDLIFDRYFSHLRTAYMIIVTQKSEKFFEYRRRNQIQPVAPLTAGIQCSQSDIIDRPYMDQMMPVKKPHYMYVKTNVAGLALLMANLGVEFDLGNYLSLNIPIYFSTVDYFTPTVKFRTLATQPELRVWPMTNRDGLFIGAHMGFAYYNFAFNGDWRYQDHQGKTPTLGGGLSLGYRLPISKDKRWKLEFGVGAGVYPIHYDVFHNHQDVKLGLLADTKQKTYIGLDNVQIGISYRIPMKGAKNK